MMSRRRPRSSVPPQALDAPSDLTQTWPRTARQESKAVLPVKARDDGSWGFVPWPAICPQAERSAVCEPPSVVRARLRELPLIYIMILAAAMLWKRAFLGQEVVALSGVDLGLMAALCVTTALLWSRIAIPLAGLKALELAMLGILAWREAVVQYRLMRLYSLSDDPMMAQLTLKNIVLVTAILILTYGLYVPKSWRRAALGAVPLALEPFVVLLVLTLQYPEAMAWLEKGWRRSTTPRIHLFVFDGMMLLIVTLSSTLGAYAISRLRRQVAEARQFGQYRLKRRIGVGGMGEVYLAEHQLLKRPCALKLIKRGDAAEPLAQERFEREVRLTATLSHPNTVEIYDYGRTEDGTYYYVMEYLRGLTLAELVEHHGPLCPGRVVYLLRQVCSALAEAHAAGLIHRDIKPSNIFAARRGGIDDIAKLLDFGLVRPSPAYQEAHISGDGQILGTPAFMSPEQGIDPWQVDARSDIYSLGAVTYHLLTGRPLFEQPDAVSLLIAHARDPVEPPSRFRPGIPEDLERVALRCVAKDPADRFPNASSLERALSACTCATEWDQERAAQWWRDHEERAETRPVPCPEGAVA
jgi:serine/threonine-protein kinase